MEKGIENLLVKGAENLLEKDYIGRFNTPYRER
jgi:hypothetical protein